MEGTKPETRQIMLHPTICGIRNLLFILNDGKCSDSNRVQMKTWSATQLPHLYSVSLRQSRLPKQFWWCIQNVRHSGRLKLNPWRRYSADTNKLFSKTNVCHLSLALPMVIELALEEILHVNLGDIIHNVPGKLVKE